MKELAKWLIDVEHLAGDFYDSASRVFKDDAKLADFLRHLAEEEAWHFQVIGSAIKYLENRPGMTSSITVDEATKAKIEAPFLENREKLEAGTLSREAVIDGIAISEFSEWNDIFLYVVNTLKEVIPKFRHLASNVQAHKQHIETFIESLPEGGVWLEKIRRLPPVWQARILIVEDYAPILEFLNTFLASEGSVETAANGKEGLQKTTEKYFDVIVTDMDMPVMDGRAFFRAVEQLYPGISDRFLFLTGNPTAKDLAFFDERRLPYLTKPMHLDEIKKAVRDIMNRMPQAKAKAS